MNGTRIMKKIKIAAALAFIGIAGPSHAVSTVNGVVVPELTWERIAGNKQINVVDQNAITVLAAERTRLDSRETNIALANSQNKKSSEFFEATVLNPSPAPVVVGMYDPYHARLRVDIIKMERVENEAAFFTALFSPRMGDVWRAAQTYAPANNKSDSVNPFALYGNGQFFEEISLAGAGVVLSHAAQIAKTPTTILGVPTFRPQYIRERYGRFYQRRIKHHFIIHGKVNWFLGSGASALPAGLEANICAIDPGAGNPCPEHRRVPNAMRFVPLKGGNVPEYEQVIRHDIKKVADYEELILLAAVGTFFVAPQFSVAWHSTLAASPALGMCYVMCTAAALEYNDSYVDGAEARARGSSFEEKYDGSFTMGVQRKGVLEQSLVEKQRVLPVFPTKATPPPPPPAEDELQTRGFAEIQRRSTANPMSGDAMPQLRVLLVGNNSVGILPTSYSERNMLMQALGISNPDLTYSDNNAEQSLPNQKYLTGNSATKGQRTESR